MGKSKLCGKEKLSTQSIFASPRKKYRRHRHPVVSTCCYRCLVCLIFILETGLIVGVAVGAVAVIASLICFITKRQQKKADGKLAYATFATPQSKDPSHASTNGTGTGAGLFQELQDLENVRVPIQDILMIQRLSEGAFGEVWKGSHGSEIVAVKRLLAGKSSVKDIKNFIEEVKLMAR